ncbi:MAG: hypothetical protein M5U01_24680 [Ardenticatenaceae bacterium]|nr:hypothetical protein [Ardenticatenaceae bacterium]
MTTPADWRAMIPQLQDVESVRFVRRLVQFQREWLDTQAAQLEEISSALEEQERKLGGS